MSFILVSYLSTIYAFFWDVLYSFWLHEEAVVPTVEPYIVSANGRIAAVEDIEGIVQATFLISRDHSSCGSTAQLVFRNVDASINVSDLSVPVPEVNRRPCTIFPPWYIVIDFC